MCSFNVFLFCICICIFISFSPLFFIFTLSSYRVPRVRIHNKCIRMKTSPVTVFCGCFSFGKSLNGCNGSTSGPQYLHIILEASVAFFSDMLLIQTRRSRSCRKTAARELRPDDIVLSIQQNKSFSLPHGNRLSIWQPLRSNCMNANSSIKWYLIISCPPLSYLSSPLNMHTQRIIDNIHSENIICTCLCPRWLT